MMREEFTERTKVEVSGRYYRDAIEPMYTKANVDKDEFCADWLKRNKQLIVKTHLADFNKMNMDVAVIECQKSELNEVKAEAASQKKENETLKNKLGLTERDLQEALRRRDAAETREKELETQIGELQENVCGTKEKLQTAATMLNEKDTEIMKLKAMLFDMMSKVA